MLCLVFVLFGRCDARVEQASVAIVRRGLRQALLQRLLYIFKACLTITPPRRQLSLQDDPKYEKHALNIPIRHLDLPLQVLQRPRPPRKRLVVQDIRDVDFRVQLE